MKNLLTYVHDSVNQTSLIGGTCSNLLRELKDENKKVYQDINISYIIERLERIQKYNKNLNGLIDKLYEENKNK